MVFTFWKRPTETLDTVGQNSLNVTLVFAKAFSLINVRLVGHSENVTGLPLKQFSCISVIPSGRTENLTPLSLNAEPCIFLIPAGSSDNVSAKSPLNASALISVVPAGSVATLNLGQLAKQCWWNTVTPLGMFTVVRFAHPLKAFAIKPTKFSGTIHSTRAVIFSNAPAVLVPVLSSPGRRLLLKAALERSSLLRVEARFERMAAKSSLFITASPVMVSSVMLAISTPQAASSAARPPAVSCVIVTLSA